MKCIFITLSCCFVFMAFREHRYFSKDENEIFIQWNKATNSSLHRQIAQSKDSIEMNKLNSRLNIDDLERVDTSSDRYKFLIFYLKIRPSKIEGIYIVEADESGAKYLKRILVVRPLNDSTVDIEAYIKGVTGWFKIINLKEFHFILPAQLNNLHAKFAKGFNNDDVIITKILSNRVVYSEYYLYGTLSCAGNLKALFDLYNTNNFIKKE